MSLKPGLYCVATPIGNLKDITYRAVETLGAADIIACEDTRVSGKLLTHYSIKATKWAYHDHNAEQVRPQIVQAIKDGKSVALISDAGTPLINDPGTKLVRACQAAGLYVTTLPGASAVPCALVLSGLMSHAFAFVGFFDKKKMTPWQSFDGTLAFFESPRRLTATLEIMQTAFAGRAVAVVREISKLFEETIRGDFETVIAHFNEHPPKGEIVIVLGEPPLPEAVGDEQLDQALSQAFESMTLKDAVDKIAKDYQMPRKTVYARALVVKEQNIKN